MKTVKILTLLALLLVLNLGQTMFPLKTVMADDIVNGTIWSRTRNGEVIDDYVFSKGLYVYTNFVNEIELPGKYRVTGNKVEMTDTMFGAISIGIINGDNMTVKYVDENGKVEGEEGVFTKDK